MFCKYCGEPLNEGEQYCIHCGKPVSAARTEKSEFSSQDAEAELMLDDLFDLDEAEQDVKKIPVKNKSYKIVSVAFLIGAIIITLTKAWYSVSESAAYWIGLGRGIGGSFMSDSTQRILDSMRNGSLRLIDSFRILRTILGLSSSLDSSSSNQETAYIVFYFSIVAALIVAVCLELILKLLDKRCNYLAFTFYIIIILITLLVANAINEGAEYKILEMSVWPVISSIFALASSIMWGKYQKSEMIVASGDAGKSSVYTAEWISGETRKKAGQVLGNGQAAAERFWKGSWGDYIRHYMVSIAISASVFIGGAILLRITGYGDFHILMQYLYTLLTAAVLGIAVVFTYRREYRMLIILSVICFVGRLIECSYMLQYASARIIIGRLFCDIVCFLVIYTISRLVHDNELIIMTACAVLTVLILIPWITYGSAGFSSYTVVTAIGTVGIVILYAFANDAFCSLFKVPEWRNSRRSADYTNACPYCGNPMDEGAVFCSRCGRKVQ